MKLKYVLMDLDGTLLPLDQKEFVQTYAKSLTEFFSKRNFDAKNVVETVFSCVHEMVKNNGDVTNEQLFWTLAQQNLKDDVSACTSAFEVFYNVEFDKIKQVAKQNERIKPIVENLKNKGLKLVVATNPLFPRIAIEKRIKWANLNIEDFVFCTTYENSNFSKPNVNYYNMILEKIGADPSECLMVGNDVDEDMIARTLGIDVFLITEFMLNRNNTDVREFANGTFDDLWEYVKNKY